ncbi:MAG: transcriptional regulator [Pseudomonadota bacterium]
MSVAATLPTVQPFQKTVQKWGNSLGIRLHSQLARLADITEGTAVSMALENEAIVIKKVTEVSPYLSEQALLADMTPYTAHTDALIPATAQELYPWSDDAPAQQT